MSQQDSGWRKLLRRLLPERGRSTPPPTIRTSDAPAVVRSHPIPSAAAYRAGSRRPAAGSRPASRSSVNRSSYDPLADPISPLHQAVYGGPFYGAGRSDGGLAPEQDCSDRSSGHGSSWSHHDSGSSSSYDGGSSYSGGSSSSSYDGGSSSCSSDSGSSW